MEKTNSFKILAVGPTGNGKSQLGNFILKNKTNDLFKVCGSIESGTTAPEIKTGKRDDINLSYIDSCGFDDSRGNDGENFIELKKFIQKNLPINLILFVLNFRSPRLRGTEHIYIDKMTELFGKEAFFNHVAFIYTNYCGENKKKRSRKADSKMEEMKKMIASKYSYIIENSDLNINDKQYFYFIDTDEDGDEYEINQEVVNHLIYCMKMNNIIHYNINSIDQNVQNNSMREEIILSEQNIKEIEELAKKIQEQEKIIDDRVKKTSFWKKFLNVIAGIGTAALWVLSFGLTIAANRKQK